MQLKTLHRSKQYINGDLKDFMEIHSQIKKTAKGEAIKTEKIGGRRTFYTDTQELFHWGCLSDTKRATNPGLG